MSKLKVSAKALIEWYLEDKYDLIHFARGVREDLLMGKTVVTSPQTIFDSIEFVPYCQVPDDLLNKEIPLSECEIIYDLPVIEEETEIECDETYTLEHIEE